MIYCLSHFKTNCLWEGRLQDVGHFIEQEMGSMASLITSLTSAYPTVHPGADERKHQSSVSLAFVQGIHRRPMNSPHKWPVTRKMFPFDGVIMNETCFLSVLPGCTISNYPSVFICHFHLRFSLHCHSTYALGSGVVLIHSSKEISLKHILLDHVTITLLDKIGDSLILRGHLKNPCCY